jgi:putative transposase
MMSCGKKFTVVQIIEKLSEAEVGISQGKTVPDIVRKLGATEQTYYRWKREYSGPLTNQSKRVKRLLADPELDKAMLWAAASGNF